MKKFQVYRQLDAMDCGPACLRMVARHFGGSFSLDYLRKLCYLTKEGVSLLSISEAAEKIGLAPYSYKVDFDDLNEYIDLPCILFWKQKHFVVLPPQNYSGKKNQKILVADPAQGLIKVSKETLIAGWSDVSTGKGFVLTFDTTDKFPLKEQESEKNNGFGFLFQYLKGYRKYVGLLFIGMILGNFLSLLFPFLTQSLVDYGINHSNPDFVTLILISQLVLFVSTTILDIIRNWLLLHMNSRINISIVSDFLQKLMRLPIRYFDTKMTGDITQRISDHNKIERFLTVNTINTIFSFFTLIVFSVILGIYSSKILFIFIIGSILSIAWMVPFFKKRKELDFRYFQQLSANQNGLFELITGMQEIKLNNCETKKRWDWERIQASLFKINVSKLTLEQTQQLGHMFFTQLKNILISFITAKEVLAGNMTLGMMLSVSYIIGQLNSPIEQILSFFRAAQDAKLSLERLREIHNKSNEEKNYGEEYLVKEMQFFRDNSMKDIEIRNLSFHYGDPHSPLVLKNINLDIKVGKTTAIVGTSGSGKTTLLKLILGFYEPVAGSIMINNKNILDLSPKIWRSQCGVVMQEGFVFSDSISNNIAVFHGEPDLENVKRAAEIANIDNFIETLPLGYNTKIGNAGNGISTGQKQRILIARAIYKNPDYFFFDEATSSLDTNNEKKIMENLDRFLKGKTVIVIAHRLSTVRNADQIIVLDNGEIVEQGNHHQLTLKKGRYFELVKNQLELGS
jgi:ATP-binding cassette subfamily B protein